MEDRWRWRKKKIDGDGGGSLFERRMEEYR